MRFNPDAQLDTSQFEVHRFWFYDTGAWTVASSGDAMVAAVTQGVALVVLFAAAVVMLSYALRPARCRACRVRGRHCRG